MKKIIVRKLLCLALAVSVFYTGCAGREANPVPAYLPGDENRSCPALNAEMAQIQAEMQRLLPKTNKFATNTLWAIGGVICIVPFFFMDLKDAEKIEYDAYRARYNRLLIIASEKQCDLSGVSTQSLPSFDEQKAIAEKVNKEISKLPAKNKEGKKLIDCKVDVLPDGQYKITPVYEGDSNQISSVVTKPTSVTNLPETSQNGRKIIGYKRADAQPGEEHAKWIPVYESDKN